MRTVRKWLAFMLAAGLMVSAMTVFAADRVGVTNDGLYIDKDGCSGLVTIVGDQYRFEGAEPVSSAVKKGDLWRESTSSSWLEWNGSAWVTPGSKSGSSSSSSSKSAAEREAEERAAAEAEKERLAQEEASREAERLAGEASDEGFADIGDMHEADEKNMSAGEYYNNAVISTPGIENAVPVGQGGNLVIDGQTTNMTASISKVPVDYVNSLRLGEAETLLNVVEVSYPATKATVNFYMPGITGTETIVALQYIDDSWVVVEVEEVRADHVTLNMEGNGVVAFIDVDMSVDLSVIVHDFVPYAPPNVTASAECTVSYIFSSGGDNDGDDDEDEEPVEIKVPHYSCSCLFTTTDYNELKQHMLQHLLKNEKESYTTW